MTTVFFNIFSTTVTIHSKFLWLVIMLVRPKNKSYVGAFPDLLPYQLPHFQLAHPAKQSLLLDGLVEATPCEGVLLM